METSFQVRPATVEDADDLTDIFMRSRAAAMPWLPPLHSAAEVRWFIEHVVLGEHTTWVVTDGTSTLGLAATKPGWLEHLYVAPEAQGRGAGRLLLTTAQEHSPDGLRLHVFQRNRAARRFYERAGFEHVADRDGSGNEEQEPDSTYRWPAARSAPGAGPRRPDAPSGRVAPPPGRVRLSSMQRRRRTHAIAAGAAGHRHRPRRARPRCRHDSHPPGLRASTGSGAGQPPGTPRS